MRRPGSLLLAIFLAASLSGCGPSGPSRVKVHGKVTFAGQPCPAPGSIIFQPIEPAKDFPRRPGSGKFATDGAYAAESLKPGDGLYPGKYRVMIECWKEVPHEGAPAGVSHLPKDFKAPELVVPAGGDPVEFNVDVK